MAVASGRRRRPAWLAGRAVREKGRGMSISAEATAFRCDDATLGVDLADRRSLAIALARFPRLPDAIPARRAAGRIGHGGAGLHWDALDEDIPVAGLPAGRGDMTNRRPRTPPDGRTPT